MEKEENSTFLDSTKISKVFRNLEKLCTAKSVFLMYFGRDFQLFLQHDHNLESEERMGWSVLLHSLGKPRVLQEGDAGEGSKGNWYSQGCPPCTCRDSDWTWPGYIEDVSGVQELTETNPDEHDFCARILSMEVTSVP